MTEDISKRRRLFRVRLIGFVLVPALGMLLFRLYQVQVLHGAEHVRATMRQSIRPIRLNPVRGRLIAADGQVLVGNRSEWDVVFHLSEMRQAGRRSNTVTYVLEQSLHLARLIGRPTPLTEDELSRHMRLRPALPITIFTNLRSDELTRISELVPPVPGLQIVSRVVREYPFPGVASHVLGFTGRRRPDDTLQTELYSRAYVTLELRGRSGLEVQYDDVLCGTPGSRLVRVNTMGYVHEQIGRTVEPENGKDLLLTLDTKAQIVAEDVLRGVDKGALVVVDAQSGGVLAMASQPSYDLSQFDWDLYQRLRTSADKPLLNRAIGAPYTPGSIMKPLVALAALEAGVIDANSEWVCDGRYVLGRRPIRCWNTFGHGSVALVDALKHSCNPFFIHAVLETGVDRLQPMFSAAGLGSRPGIDLPGAEGGYIPSRAFARERWGRDWIAIDTAYASIGQGAVGVTPLQAALFAAAIGNGGKVFRPYLVQSICSPDGRALQNTAPVVEHRLPVSPEHLALVQQGMTEAVSGEHGTAWRAGNPAISLAGKTGTAEVGLGGEEYKDTWIICFGPVEEPRYALACLVEHGASGGRTAAPLAGQFFRRWLQAGGDEEPLAAAE
jgi:penicillin-binding protein 2